MLIASRKVDTMSERILIGDAGDFIVGKLQTVDVNGKSVVITRTENGLCGLRNQCSHLPLPINGGKVENGTVVCPWHNSRFDVCTGENLDWVPGVAGIKLPRWSQGLMAMGKKPQGIQSYTVIEEDGKVYVEV
jgi:nitrite reductase/ring-hydroxylating ferredoxin subunit